MKNQFVTYEIAKRLKELGFNEPCLMLANPNFLWDFPTLRNNSELDSQNSHNHEARKIVAAVPLWQQAIAFLRNNKWNKYGYILIQEAFNGWNVQTQYDNAVITESWHSTRESAITKALTLIK